LQILEDMNENEIVIYGFRLGNSDPDFQEFVRSLSNEDVHNLRKILYDQKLSRYKDGSGAAVYGKDRYGLVAVPESIKQQQWEKAGNELFSFIKDIWVASILGYTDPGMNPIKQHQWKVTRIRAVTSTEEGVAAVLETAVELALQYIGLKGIGSFGKVPKNSLYAKTKFPGEYHIKPFDVYFKPIKYQGQTTGFSIGERSGYGAQQRIDYHRLDRTKKKTHYISPGRNKKLLHYHRGHGNNLHRHRPWEKSTNDKSFWDRF